MRHWDWGFIAGIALIVVMCVAVTGLVIGAIYEISVGQGKRDRSRRAECTATGGTVLPSSEGWTCAFPPTEKP